MKRRSGSWTRHWSTAHRARTRLCPWETSTGCFPKRRRPARWAHNETSNSREEHPTASNSSYSIQLVMMILNLYFYWFLCGTYVTWLLIHRDKGGNDLGCVRDKETQGDCWTTHPVGSCRILLDAQTDRFGCCRLNLKFHYVSHWFYLLNRFCRQAL